MTMITLINPWSNAVVYKDVADLVNNFDSYLSMISDETIETINDKVDSDDAGRAGMPAGIALDLLRLCDERAQALSDLRGRLRLCLD